MKKALVVIGTITILLLMSTKRAFARPTTTGNMRGCDPLGCGHFGASRGSRTHQGEDYVARPGDPVFSPISGQITRMAYPYATDSRYKGLEIINSQYRVKIFYMEPEAAIGSMVSAGQRIGAAQDISMKHGAAMTNHIHVEIRNRAGELLKFSDLL